MLVLGIAYRACRVVYLVLAKQLFKNLRSLDEVVATAGHASASIETCKGQNHLDLDRTDFGAASGAAVQILRTLLVGTDLGYNTGPPGHPSQSFRRLPTRLLYKRLLQLPNLLLEILHLLPAIQGPPVVRPQTRHQTLLRLLHFRTRFLQLLARFELFSQVHDLFLHAVVRAFGRWLGGGWGERRGFVLVEGRAEVVCERVGIAGGLGGGLAFFGRVRGEGRGQVRELVGLVVAYSLEFAVDSLLDLEVEVFGSC